jgi:hypothetical protein
VKQNGDKPHVGQVLVMTQKCAPNTLHFVASVEAKFSLGVVVLDGLHEVGCMKVTASFTYDEKVFHSAKITQK